MHRPLRVFWSVTAPSPRRLARSRRILRNRALRPDAKRPVDNSVGIVRRASGGDRAAQEGGPGGVIAAHVKNDSQNVNNLVRDDYTSSGVAESVDK